MVQDQLTDYISSQVKLGVSRDAIKSALVSAGWVAADVEDTLKKVEGSNPMQAVAAKPMQTAQPATMSTANSMSSAKPMTAAKTDPQMIRVSDLISSSPMATSTMASTKPAQDSGKMDVNKFGGKISGNTFESSPAMAHGGGKGNLIMGVVAGILVIIFAGLAWYFYSGNSALASQVNSLNAQSASVNSQLATLKSAVDASSTNDTAQIASLTAANADLSLDLSFFAVPLDASTSSVATELPVTISGSLAATSKNVYSIVTPRGARIFITSSAIDSQLKPLVGDSVELSGTYIQGSDAITANAVTNLSVAAATSTAMTTTSTATSSAQ